MRTGNLKIITIYSCHWIDFIIIVSNAGTANTVERGVQADFVLMQKMEDLFRYQQKNSDLFRPYSK